MLRFRSLALVLCLSIMTFSSVAEASSFDFNGGSEGIIIWDGDFDVSTMQNNCAAPGDNCATSLLNFADPASIQLFLTGGVGLTLEFTSLSIVLSVPLDYLTGLDCGAFVCGDASTIYPGLNHDNVHHPDPNLPPAGEGPQGVIVLPMLTAPQFVQHGDTFHLTDAAQQFLGTLTPGPLWRLGIDLAFTQQAPPGVVGLTFMLSTEAPTSAVPEPGTMLLLGSGLAVAARRLRRGLKAR